MLRERAVSLAWLRKEIERADDTDNPVVPAHVRMNRETPVNEHGEIVVHARVEWVRCSAGDARNDPADGTRDGSGLSLPSERCRRLESSPEEQR